LLFLTPSFVQGPADRIVSPFLLFGAPPSRSFKGFRDLLKLVLFLSSPDTAHVPGRACAGSPLGSSRCEGSISFSSKPSTQLPRSLDETIVWSPRAHRGPLSLPRGALSFKTNIGRCHFQETTSRMGAPPPLNPSNPLPPTTFTQARVSRASRLASPHLLVFHPLLRRGRSFALLQDIALTSVCCLLLARPWTPASLAHHSSFPYLVGHLPSSSPYKSAPHCSRIHSHTRSQPR